MLPANDQHPSFLIDSRNRKNKISRTPSLKSNSGSEKSVRSLKTLKLIVGNKSSPIQGPGARTVRKTTQTVTFQFQQSLNQLMETL